VRREEKYEIAEEVCEVASPEMDGANAMLNESLDIIWVVCTIAMLVYVPVSRI
jgi:hypothetical protein